MRINDQNLQGISPPATGASQQVRPAEQQNSATAASGRAGGSDQVQLSSLADRMGAASLAADAPATAERSARIAQLSKLVQSGNYNPDPEKVADSMIRDMLPGGGSV